MCNRVLSRATPVRAVAVIEAGLVEELVERDCTLWVGFLDSSVDLRIQVDVVVEDESRGQARVLHVDYEGGRVDRVETAAVGAGEVVSLGTHEGKQRGFSDDLRHIRDGGRVHGVDICDDGASVVFQNVLGVAAVLCEVRSNLVSLRILRDNDRMGIPEVDNVLTLHGRGCQVGTPALVLEIDCPRDSDGSRCSVLRQRDDQSKFFFSLVVGSQVRRVNSHRVGELVNCVSCQCEERGVKVACGHSRLSQLVVYLAARLRLCKDD